MEFDVTSFASGMFYWVLIDGIASIFTFFWEKARLMRAERKNLENKK